MMELLAAASVSEEMGDAVVRTLALAIAAGGLLMTLAKRLQIPGIVLLLIGGVALGPEGIGLVEPETMGSALNLMVTVAVGLILFEGGLTLDLGGYRSASRVIRNLLSVGVVVTWAGAALAIWLIFGVDPVFAVLAGSLVIVTGPTVIQPILKRIRLKWKLHHILHWESVLIDPIGVFLAVLAFELVVFGGTETALIHLLARVLGGLAIGYIGGELLAWVLKRRLVPDEVVNVFMVGAAMAVFGLTEGLVSGGGLLSVTVAGLICGSRQPPALKAIVEFKSILVDLLIGFVFILLTARLQLQQFIDFGLRGFALVAVIILVVRPLTVWVSTLGAGLRWRELVFLSWVAPRGVVAASMGSLFAITLAEQGRFDNPQFIETFVYSVIFATVLLQGFTAGPLAALLRLREKSPDGWLIVGAHPLAREIARFLERIRKVPVLLVDGNRRAVLEAGQDGLRARMADARDTAAIEQSDAFHGLGRMLAFTDNEDLNELLCKKWEPVFGKGNVYRWAAAGAGSSDAAATGTVLWGWMPKPSMVSSEILLGEAAVVEMQGPRKADPGPLAALASAHETALLLDPKPGSQLAGDSGRISTLYLQREADYLLNALHPQSILLTDASDREVIYHDMLQRIRQLDANMDLEEAFDKLTAQEAHFPSTLGHGVALPHLHLPGLGRTLCLVAQVKDGVEFPGDPEPVRLIFMVFSPPSLPEHHLAVIGEIARICSSESLREELLGATSADALLESIRRYRRQHTPFADVRG
jgi:NhaP-type Na+/H+ or K+/H+ antiporter/mannitol/fructose-specific phosphotransferase system IIA component (Ntr-type)